MDKKNIYYFIGIGVALFMFFFLVTINIIGQSVKEKCLLAKDKYGGDCVAALINYLDDENNSFESRNSAIWALGQLGDKRALPVLKKYYTGYNGEKQKRDEGLAQLELKRAIGYMEGSPNITTFFWRFGNMID